MPKFETVTTNQISALTLELEPSKYEISFESNVDNILLVGLL